MIKSVRINYFSSDRGLVNDQSYIDVKTSSVFYENES